MSGSSLDGLDIANVEFELSRSGWQYKFLHVQCKPFTSGWLDKLRHASRLSALDYQLLDTEFGRHIGEQVQIFIQENNLQGKIDFIASHGHTVFHCPGKKMTSQIGDGASIAAITQIPVISNLRNMDIALGGQGAPIVPIGEKFLFSGYRFFLNLGGIANISFINTDGTFTAFDVCPANRVLDMLAALRGKSFDHSGELAASGKVNARLLERLQALEYYRKPSPKSLSNDFGVNIVYPMVIQAGLTCEDALCTYVEHISMRVAAAVANCKAAYGNTQMLVTGGGACNTYLVEKISSYLKKYDVSVFVPDESTIHFKEAIIMAFMGVLRWRGEVNVLSSVTGSSASSIGGALWLAP